jgi:hypothetical protein
MPAFVAKEFYKYLWCLIIILLFLISQGINAVRDFWTFIFVRFEMKSIAFLKAIIVINCKFYEGVSFFQFSQNNKAGNPLFRF